MKTILFIAFFVTNFLHFAYAATPPVTPAIPTPNLDLVKNTTVVGATHQITIPGQFRPLTVAITTGNRKFNQGTASIVLAQVTLLANTIGFLGVTRSNLWFLGAKIQLAIQVEIEYYNLPTPTNIRSPLTNLEASTGFSVVVAQFRTNDLAWTVSEAGVNIAEGRIRVMKPWERVDIGGLMEVSVEIHSMKALHNCASRETRH